MTPAASLVLIRAFAILGTNKHTYLTILRRSTYLDWYLSFLPPVFLSIEWTALSLEKAHEKVL
jgi:hypothetical protein